MRSAAFFDLDGTLLSVNSAALWVRRERKQGRLSRRQVARAALFFAAYRLSFVNMERALRAALLTVKGVEERILETAVRDWYRTEIAQLAAPGAFAAIESHRERGDLLVLLTSSSPYAAQEAKEQFGLDHALSMRYEVFSGRFTGKAIEPLCYGPGKVALAQQLADQHDIDIANSAFYTDSFTDLPMLLAVGSPHVVNADVRLRREARKRGWPLLDWRDGASESRQVVNRRAAR